MRRLRIDEWTQNFDKYKDNFVMLKSGARMEKLNLGVRKQFVHRCEERLGESEIVMSSLYPFTKDGCRWQDAESIAWGVLAVCKACHNMSVIVDDGYYELRRSYDGSEELWSDGFFNPVLNSAILKGAMLVVHAHLEVNMESMSLT